MCRSNTSIANRLQAAHQVDAEPGLRQILLEKYVNVVLRHEASL